MYPVVERHQGKSYGPAEDAIRRARPSQLPAVLELFDQACGDADGETEPAKAENLFGAV
jgi:hypothetical protein